MPLFLKQRLQEFRNRKRAPFLLLFYRKKIEINTNQWRDPSLFTFIVLALLTLLGTQQQTPSPQSPGVFSHHQLMTHSLAFRELSQLQIDSQKGLSYSHDFRILINASLPSSTSEIILESLISDKRLNVLVHILNGLSWLCALPRLKKIEQCSDIYLIKSNTYRSQHQSILRKGNHSTIASKPYTRKDSFFGPRLFFKNHTCQLRLRQTTYQTKVVQIVLLVKLHTNRSLRGFG